MEILCGKRGEILAQTLPQYFSSIPQFQEYPEKFKKFPTERPKHIWAKIEHVRNAKVALADEVEGRFFQHLIGIDLIHLGAYPRISKASMG